MEKQCGNPEPSDVQARPIPENPGVEPVRGDSMESASVQSLPTSGPLGHVKTVHIGNGKRVRVALPDGVSEAAINAEVRNALLRIEARLKAIKAGLSPDEKSAAAELIRKVLPLNRLAAAIAALIDEHLANAVRQHGVSVPTESLLERSAPRARRILEGLELASGKHGMDVYSVLAEWFLAHLHLLATLDVEQDSGMALADIPLEEFGRRMDQWWEKKGAEGYTRLTESLLWEAVERLSYAFLETLGLSRFSRQGMEHLLGILDNPSWFQCDIAAKAVEWKEGQHLHEFITEVLRLPAERFLETTQGLEQRGWENADRDPIGWLRSRDYHERRRELTEGEEQANLLVPLDEVKGDGEGISLADTLPDTGVPKDLAAMETMIDFDRTCTELGSGSDNVRNKLEHDLIVARLHDGGITRANAHLKLGVSPREIETAWKRCRSTWRRRFLHRLGPHYAFRRPDDWQMRSKK
jgi:hypothetical protein